MTKTDNNNSWITSDPEMAKLYNEDKKMDFNFTLNGYIGLIQATEYSCEFSNILKIKLFEKGRHEILNEVNRKEVYEYIKAWLDEKSYHLVNIKNFS